MLVLSKEMEYGLLFLSYIYRKGSKTNLSNLVEKTGLPKRFLARIASKLVKTGLLISQEGKYGGYYLGKKIKKTTLYEYLKNFRQEIIFCSCQDEKRCRYDKFCHHKSFNKKFNRLIINQLKKIKLIELL
ncbi:MAG: Rrf2 family transcriptional regulator [Microgenomates group bacterium]|jgi:Rrf2 family protein|nr:Rrf2 family transcriptional regulator [Microgenomates group bacterium]